MGTKMKKLKGTSPENMKAVLTVIRRKPGVGRSEISEKTSLDPAVLGRVLHKLKAEKAIKTEGSFRWATYQARPVKPATAKRTTPKAEKVEAKS